MEQVGNDTLIPWLEHASANSFRLRINFICCFAGCDVICLMCVRVCEFVWVWGGIICLKLGNDRSEQRFTIQPVLCDIEWDIKSKCRGTGAVSSSRYCFCAVSSAPATLR